MKIRIVIPTISKKKVRLKKKVKRSLEGKPVLHNLSPSSALEPQTRDERRRSSFGSTISSGGKKKKGPSRRSSSGSTGSTVSLSPKISAKEHTEAIEALQMSKDEEIKRLEDLLAQANLDKEVSLSRNEQLLKQMHATWGEIQAQFFLNGVRARNIKFAR